jgi:CubicO group peptidase (beta-lactamase class C family)
MSRTASLQDALTELVQRSKTPGLQYLVVSPSSTVFEFAGGLASIAPHRAMQMGTTMMAYSMSKTITAAAVLQPVEAALLRLDEPVARYIDWQPYGGEITIRQLLSHTSGLPNPVPLRWVHPCAQALRVRRARLLRSAKRTTAGPIPMTLGRHISSTGVRFFYKEGGGGFHSMMRLYPERGLGSVVMVNATSFDVRALVDTLDAAFLS